MKLMPMMAVHVLLCSLVQSQVGDEQHRLATELVALTKLQSSLENMHTMYAREIHSQLALVKIPDELRGKVAALERQFVDSVFEEEGFKKLQSDIAEVYASSFTRDELAALVEFYRTPSGRAYAEKGPAVMQRILEVMKSRIQTMTPRLQQLREEFVQKVVKEVSGTK